jgi:hypothetical protein
MKRDLIERLRDIANPAEVCAQRSKAADRIEQLERENKELHELLQWIVDSWPKSDVHYFRADHEDAVAAARKALTQSQEPPKSLLRSASELPQGCRCPPDKCMAPRIMGRQMPCRRTSNKEPAK